jgi:hypothetical protein
VKARIYIAGPIGLGKTATMQDVSNNLARFHSAAHALRQLGYAVENPAETPQYHHWNWSDFMRSGITQLLSCNAVLLLPAWEQSRGARIEKELATSLGFDVRTAEEWGVST